MAGKGGSSGQRRAWKRRLAAQKLLILHVLRVRGQWTTKENVQHKELETGHQGLRIKARLRLELETGRHMPRGLVEDVKVDKVSKGGLIATANPSRHQQAAQPGSDPRGMGKLTSLGSS